MVPKPRTAAAENNTTHSQPGKDGRQAGRTQQKRAERTRNGKADTGGRCQEADGWTWETHTDRQT